MATPVGSMTTNALFREATAIERKHAWVDNARYGEIRKELRDRKAI